MLDKIEYRLVTKDDYEAVLDLLRNHFYWDEPVKKALGPQFQDLTDEEQFYLDVLKNDPPTSLLAVCSGKIVGVIIGGPLYPGRYKHTFELVKKVIDPKLKAEIILFATLERDANIFERFKVDRVIQIYLVAVHADYRCFRVGFELTVKFVDRARELGYQIVTTDCTSVHSVRIVERLGFVCTNVLKMADFRDPVNGEQILFPKEESQEIKTYVKFLLSQDQKILSKY